MIKLALILPVATATINKIFLAFKLVKNRLHDQIRGDLLNDCVVTYINKDIFKSVDNEKILQCFHYMKSCNERL
jgi:hypothetical protein